MVASAIVGTRGALFRDMTNQQTPTADQTAALQRYATRHGRTWKSQLSLAWSTGGDETEDDSVELRQVRNTLGPTWLYRTCKIKP